MNRFAVRKDTIRNFIKKPHFQVFVMSFFVCFTILVGMAKDSGSNVAPYFSAIRPDPAIVLQNQSVNPSAPQRSRIGELISGIFPDMEMVEIEVRRGDTLSSMLGTLGITYPEVREVSQSMSAMFKVSDLRPGSDRVVAKIRRGSGERPRAELVSLEIIRSPVHKIRADRTPNGFEAVEERSSVSAELVKREGVITKGSGLIEIALRAEIPYNVIDKFYEVFSFDIDFEREIHPGDRFQMMFEQLYSERGDHIGSGELVFASLYLNARRSELKLYRHESANGTVGYFDEKGNSAVRTLKKSPLNNARVSSRFGSRRHPILGFTRDHKGVDFAAPEGTPIPAAGSGVIVERGWKGDYGNYIKIKHNNTYSTAYGHMKSFRSGLRVGSRVNQGQIIGFVGNTGLSTGPHLHYEIIRNGMQVNPLTIRLPSTQNLNQTELARFGSSRDRINMQFAILNKDFNQFGNLLSLGGLVGPIPARR